MIGLNLGSGLSGLAAVDVLHMCAEWKSVDVWERAPDAEHYDFSEGIREPDESFDCIWMGDSFEHILRARAHKVLSECLRVLRPCGFLWVCVPDMAKVMPRWLAADGQSQELNSLVFGQQGDGFDSENAYPDAHMQGFTEGSLHKMLLDAGFAFAKRATIHGGACWYELAVMAVK